MTMPCVDAFLPLEGRRRWLAWRLEVRGSEKARPTKVPYNPNRTGAQSGYASSTDPTSWGMRIEAERRSSELNGDGGTTGVGITLGDLGDGTFLAGVDLDSSLDRVRGGVPFLITQEMRSTLLGLGHTAEDIRNMTPQQAHEIIAESGIPARWAAEILAVLSTYTEVSPSGNGLKAFFLLRAEHVRPFLNLIGVDQHAWGCRRSIPGFSGADHGPAIEIYTSARYFAVTERLWSIDHQQIVQLDWPQLEALAATITTATNGSTGGTGGGLDNSRSAKALRAALRMRPGTFEEMVEALRKHPDPGIREWVAEKGEAHGQRELRRIWDRFIAAREDDKDDGIPPEHSDEALALRFSDRHADTVRYLALRGSWLLWGGSCWHFENTLRVFDLSRAICRADSATITDPVKLARDIAGAKTVAAVERLARADRRHATELADWDACLTKFAMPDATVDLTTGKTHPPCRDDMITKLAAVRADPDCPTPLWTASLDTITAGDEELQKYLQRMAGYCMTGLTIEHVLFFLYGTGANGKGVFINTIADIFKDYAAIAPIEMFFESKFDRHPTELAHLWGARLAIAQEVEQNRRWNEAKIKGLTGGDKITARFMRQDFFDFVPRFKLVIAGNNKPSLRGVDEAIRRRIHLVPFIVTIAPEDRDPHLREKLRPEWPGILWWVIEGAVEWHQMGLAPPEAVVAATKKYFMDQDRLGQWLEECCVVDKVASALSATLFDSWKKWNEESDERYGSQKAFSQSLEKAGFERDRDPVTRKKMFFGLRLSDAGDF